jgi:hypothetical protein
MRRPPDVARRNTTPRRDRSAAAPPCRRRAPERTVEHGLGGAGDLVEDRARGVVRADRHGLLADDAARIRLRRHVVQRRAGLALAVEHRPVDRRPAAVAGQQRAVHVERAARGNREQRRAEHAPVVEAEQEVGARERMRSTNAGAFASSGAVHGMPKVSATSDTRSNHRFSPGSSRCVTTSGTSTPWRASTRRQRAPTSW